MSCGSNMLVTTSLQKSLWLVQGVLAGNGKGRGQGRLAAEGLVTRLVAAWCVTPPLNPTARRASTASASVRNGHLLKTKP